MNVKTHQALPGVGTTYRDGGDAGVATVGVELDEAALGRTAVDVVNELLAGDPIVAVIEDGIDHGRFALTPVCLTDAEGEMVVARLRAVLGRAPLRRDQVRALEPGDVRGRSP